MKNGEEKMKLIDVEKLKIQEIYDEDLKAHFVVEEDDLAERPEVKAIPIEFLDKWFGNNYNAFTDLMMAWEKENETN